MYRRFFMMLCLCGAVVLTGCDLQPKIASIPDSIGEFISQRYPALLADPETQPEIYNSAVTDYGIYASPELYGSDKDYLVYASVDDYILVPDEEEQKTEVVKVEKTESGAKESKPKVKEQSKPEQQDEYLIVPQYVKTVSEQTEEKTEINIESGDFVVVVRGDTLYSIARKCNTTVAELAKINSLQEPYTLSIGQKLKTRNPIEAEQSEQLKVQPRKPEKENVKPKQPEQVKHPTDEIRSAKMAKQDKVAVKPVKAVGVENTKRVAVQEITVVAGDTLYSLSRKYQIPVNDLAVMNKLSSPFTLSVGQKLKVPKLDNVEIRSAQEIKKIKSDTKAKVVVQEKQDKKITSAKPNTEKQVVNKKDTLGKKSQTVSEKNINKATNTVKKAASRADKTPAKTTQKTKISSNPKQQLPKIASRSSSKFSWPIRGKILSQYGSKNNGLFNDGINIAAAQGAAVKAAENGVVAYAGNEVKGMGNLVIIQHSDGWMTIYAHLDSMSVKRGSKVSVGGVIGKIGKTGKVDKPQLHFEIRKGTKAYNPISYLKK